MIHRKIIYSVPVFNRKPDFGVSTVNFRVVCLVAKPIYDSEARVDFVVIQTLLLYICKSLCYHANLDLCVYGIKVTPNLVLIQRLGYNSPNCKKKVYSNSLSFLFCVLGETRKCQIRLKCRPKDWRNDLRPCR